MIVNEKQLKQLNIIGKALDLKHNMTTIVWGNNPKLVIVYMIGYLGSSLGISKEIEEVE